MTTPDGIPFTLLVLLGPTASGKTSLGIRLAQRLNGEIISADSRQVYRGMDIGSGKDLSEYGDVPYHLIDIADPGSEFNLFRFQRLFFKTYADIRSRGRLPLLVGGTGMYLQSALAGDRLAEAPPNPELRRELDALSMDALATRLRESTSSLHNTTDLLHRDRLIRAIEIAESTMNSEPEPVPEIYPLVLGIRWERGELRSRITRRLRERLEQGMIEEVESLHTAGLSWQQLEFYGLEYRFVSLHLKGELTCNDMFQKLNSAIHDFAKRQETWFRRMERNGIAIRWLDGSGDPFAEAMVIVNETIAATSTGSQ